MTYEADGVTLLLGDCRAVMAQMDAESVSCCVTSPPYWGLRKYECEPSIWGGDKDCPHTLGTAPLDGESYAGRKRWQHEGVSRQETPDAWVKAPEREKDRQHLKELGERDGSHGGAKASSMIITQGGDATCSLCGAWRGQLGLEPTVALYIEHTMEWIKEVWRVMRKDGVFWLDIGDSRAGSWGNYGVRKGGQRPQNVSKFARSGATPQDFRPGTSYMKPKSLCLIPQRIAIACQEAGWIVRSIIVIPSWMPESAKDRPTDAYRQVLMLVRSPKYWYDAQAVRVAGSNNTHTRASAGQTSAAPCETEEAIARRGRLGVFTDGRNYDYQPGDLRNLGNIWDIPPAAYPDAHFATFPIEEPLRCITASCPAEVCVKCGKARVRMVSNGRISPLRGNSTEGPAARADDQSMMSGYGRSGWTPGIKEAETLGWTDCGCGAGFGPGFVLDPFVGTGTTAVAARMLGRRCIGIDVSEHYLKQAVTRLTVGDVGIRRMVAARRAGAEQGRFDA